MEEEIVKYVAKRTLVPLKELETYISTQHGVSIKTAYYHIKKLVDRGVLRYRRSSDRRIYVEVSPSFVAYIAELYSYLSRIRERMRYYEKKVE